MLTTLVEMSATTTQTTDIESIPTLFTYWKNGELIHASAEENQLFRAAAQLQEALHAILGSGLLSGSYELHDRMQEVAYDALEAAGSLPRY